MLLLLAACIGLQAVPTDAYGDSASTSGTVGGLTVSSTLVDFGTVAPDDLTEETIVLLNEGTNAVQVELTLSGDGFEVDRTSVSVLGGNESVLTLGFQPDDVGEYEGSLMVSAGGDHLEVALTGVGDENTPIDTGDTQVSGGGDIAADSTSLNFGTIDVDSSSMLQVYISNEGTDVLTVDSMSSGDAAFVLGGNLSPPRQLDPGESRVIEVTFTPTSERTYTTTLSVKSDDSDEKTLSISLSGSGEDTCDFCAPRIDVDTGGDPYSITDFFSFFGGEDSRTLTVSNDGDETLNVSDVSVNNDFLATCGTFRVKGWGGAKALAPGASTSFQLAYTATSECLDVPQKALDCNVLHITSNDPAEADYVIELGGAGL